MVRIASLIGAAAALYAGVTSAAPMPGMKMEDSTASSSAVADMSMATASSSYGSSYGSSSSNYGSSGSSSSYGSSGSSDYGSSSSSDMNMVSNDCGSSGCDSSSKSSSSSSECGSSGCDNKSSAEAMATETSSAVASQYTSPSYGSGSSSYGSSSSSSSYDSCVQQCVASYGMPSAMSMPSATASSGSYGSGATHTVYVAPTQGVLRYVPFAVNASVGDTVKFIWGGGPHTVTKSSVLGICNKTSDAPFTSGVQNKSFTFTQMVNDTNATFFYCGVATHCQKGMFGIMNPPNAAGAASSVDAMMPTIAANDSATAAAWAYTTNITANNTGAAAWGGSMDMSGMPDWAMSDMAQNVMYTRAFLAANPEALAEDGTVDLSRISEGSIMNPPDVAALSAASPAPAAGASSASAGASAGAASASASPAASPAAAGNAAASAPSAKVNGAGMISSPRVLVAFAAVGAAFFAL